MAAPGRGQFERDELSRLLRHLRNQAGLGGRELAARAGFGQSKLSKIETGLLLPTHDDVEAICRAAEATAAQRDAALDLATAARGEIESARIILRRGAYRKQQQVARIEAQTRLHRSFDLGAVIGLLQTPDYMQQVFVRRLSPGDQAKAIDARRNRQQILNDPGKRFELVMTEGALRWRVSSGARMAAQIEHIAEVSRLPNVSVGVIPWMRQAHVLPGHEIHLYDEWLAIVAIETATATIEDPRDIAIYVELFTELASLADFGEAAAPLLRQIAQDYRNLPD